VATTALLGFTQAFEGTKLSTYRYVEKPGIALDRRLGKRRK
jgi:hypothetical protein